ncbi:MAG: NFACT RNA binding domain-containing protein [Synechococcaceae cyanobacterium]|nr:NFACT RNA binding domain-containing protein [Synechococcaceae cyanobacterium]
MPTPLGPVSTVSRAGLGLGAIVTLRQDSTVEAAPMTPGETQVSAAGPLQPLDITSLLAVLSELRPQLLPSRFEKAQQPDGRTLQLALRSLEGCHWLELSWLAEAPRLLAITAPPRQGEGSTLARQLQHSLRGLALVELRQQGWERLVELGFARRPGEAPSRWLVLELMGRHSNLFLLDQDQRVIALGHQVKAAQSRQRPIGTGSLWTPPPPLAGEPPSLAESEASWRRRLSLLPLPLGQALADAYQGISPSLCRQLLWRLDPVTPAQDAPQALAALLQQPVQALPEASWPLLHRRWRLWLEAIQQGRFAFRGGGATPYRCWPQPADLPAGESPAAPAAAPLSQAAASEAADGRDGRDTAAPPGADPLAINHALAAYYGSLLRQRHLNQQRHALRQRLEQALGRERRSLDQQQSLLDAVPAHRDLQQQADALLSQPSPGRDAIEAAQALYRKARRLRRSAAAIEPRLELHRQRLAALEASLTYLEQADPEQPDSAVVLTALAEDLTAFEGRGKSGTARRPRPPAAAPQPLELRCGSGLRLQVGRNHRQNEWISLRQARRGDLWFHAQECPGSHVVLKASEAAPADPDLQAAADLAAWFSRARGNTRVPVVMVDIEALQRIPGAVPGTVRHRGGSVLWGEPRRALALLQAAGHPGPAGPPNVEGEQRP